MAQPRRRAIGRRSDYRLRKQGRRGVREITIMAIFPIDQSFSSATYRSAFIDAFSFDHP